MIKTINQKRIVGLIICCIAITIISGSIIYNKNKIDRELLQENLKIINDTCNKVYLDINSSEKEYLRKLESEKDPFNVGMYSSALVQIYTVRNDYEKVIYYANQATDNYRKLPGGEYYAIAENKYLAWGLLRMGMYAESFTATNSLLEMLKSLDERILTDEEVKDTEVLIYTIFLTIYSDLDILDMSKFYYEKLNSIELTPSIKKSRGDKVAFSKMLYAKKINDKELMSQYANECYDLSVERDKENGTNLANSVIINVANADLELGRYDKVLENLKKAEDYYLNLGDIYGIAGVYDTYGLYYEKTNNIDLANEYYKKSIDEYKKVINDYELIDVINKYIVFLRDNNLGEQEDIESYYELYYQLSEQDHLDTKLNELVAKIVRVNEELSDSRISSLQKQVSNNNMKFVTSLVMILLLGFMIIKMASAIKKKNITEKKLEEIANKDYLTGVNTRSYGDKLISELMDNNTKFSFAVLDIDNFKNVNDTYGHIFGDNVLKVIADKIKEGIQKDDIVIRFGGEEFIIVFVECSILDAKEILDKIRIDVNNVVFDNDVMISISAGIKEWDGVQNIEDLMIDADMLLYKAKNEGKNKVVI